MDDVIDGLREYGQQFELKLDNAKTSYFKFDPSEYATNTKKDFEKMMTRNHDELETKILVQALETLYELIRKEQDAIWPYILRNMYKPIAIAYRKVNIIIGNPPWIAQQAMHDKAYKEYLKAKSVDYGLVEKSKIHNIPNMELATLFFSHCVSQYLEDGGVIGFVMPRSVLDASQHVKFREFKKPEAKLNKIYDLRDVEPLFRIPSCVIIAEKGKTTTYPVKTIEFDGKLDSSNEQLKDALKTLKLSKTEFSPVNRVRKNSPYHKLFNKGADLIPRIFWFVDIKSDSFLGFNPENPHIISSINKNARKPWKDLSLEGNVAKRFLFNTLVATDLIPFGILQRRLVFLPIIIENNKIELIKSSNDSEINHSDTSKYLEKIESSWKKYSKGPASELTPYQWINYHGKLTKQKPSSKFKVIYAGSATYMTAAVLKPDEYYSFDINGTEFITKNFITDVATYYFDTDIENEAYYLAAVFNSKTIDDLIKPEQSKGTFGPRNIHKLPLTFNIPKYDPQNNEHKKIADLGKICTKKVSEILPTITTKSIGVIRRKLRDSLKENYLEIDSYVKQILKD